MPTLILVRHGRTTANASGVLAGRSKGVHLDETGADQARRVGERLSSLPLAAVVTSPLERCRETAREITRRQAAGSRAVSDRRLLECDYGSWTGRELSALAKESAWKTVQDHPAAAIFPGGESMAAMAARGVSAVREWDARIEREHGPHAVWAAVSHGDLVKAVVADALGMHLDLFQRLVADPGSLSVLRYTTHRPFVVTVNSTSGDLSALKPPKRRRKRATSDADVGGGAGPGR